MSQPTCPDLQNSTLNFSLNKKEQQNKQVTNHYLRIKLSRECVSVKSRHLVSIHIKLSHEVVNLSKARGVAPYALS